MLINPPLVSIIIPAYNASEYIEECFQSIEKQTYRPLEISIFNDASTDNTLTLLYKWKKIFKKHEIQFIITNSIYTYPNGSGYGKNKAIEKSNGFYLCFIDSDDIMLPDRIQIQLDLCIKNDNHIIGSNFIRIPEGSTQKYTKWANNLNQNQLILQQYRECTIIMPTWFMNRKVYECVGGFSEKKTKNLPTPDDLIFFLKHLELGGGLTKAEKPLIIYRHRINSVSANTPRRLLLRTRIISFERRVIENWNTFTIWGAGRDGKNFYMDLSIENKRKVKKFCDIDPKKINRYYPCSQTKRKIPIIHFSNLLPPVVCCVVWGSTNGLLEKNIASLGLIEGDNLWHFT